MYRVCSMCKETKEYSEFQKNSATNLGISSACKNCLKEYYIKKKRTKLGLISAIYTEQKNSCKDRKHELPKYSKEELIEWALNQPNFNILYNNWVQSGHNKWERPSIDRIDNFKTYSLDNIQLVTFKENNARSHIDAANGDQLGVNLIEVEQYDLEGNFIRSYKSMSEASKQTGISVGAICTACNKKESQTELFLWKRANDPIMPKAVSRTRTYYQYDDEDNLLFSSNNTEEIKSYLNKKDLSPLNKALRLNRKYLGYTWKTY